MTTTQTPTELKRYAGWAPAQSMQLYGLGRVGSGLAVACFVLSIMAFMFVGNRVGSLIFVGGFIFVVVPFLLKDRWGKTIYHRIGLMFLWRWHTLTGRNVRLQGPLSGEPVHRQKGMGFTGLASPMSFAQADDGVGIIVHPGAAQVAVVWEVTVPGIDLLDPEYINNAVGQWGETLTALTSSQGLVQVAIVHEVATDEGAEHRRNMRETVLLNPGINREAQSVAAEMGGWATSNPLHRYFLTATWDLPGHPRKHLAPFWEDVLRPTVATASEAIQQAFPGGHVVLSAMDIARVLKSMVNPSTSAAIQLHRPDVAFNDLAPKTWIEGAHWVEMEDGLKSRSWAMTKAPDANTKATVFRLMEGGIVNGTVRYSTVYETMDPSNAPKKAANLVEARTFNTEQKRTVTAVDRAGIVQAEKLGEQVAEGGNLLSISRSVTVTTDAVEPTRLDPTIRGQAEQRAVGLDPFSHRHGTAWLATLPIGLNVEKHIAVPSGLREAPVR